MFQFGVYDNLRREQAVKLLTEIGHALCGVGVEGVKPTEWRSVVLAFLERKPDAKRNKVYSDAEYARYVGKQLVVIMCHLRRIVQNDVKFQNCVNVAAPQCRKDGKQLRGLFRNVVGDTETVMKAAVRKPASHKRKARCLRERKSLESEASPDLEVLQVPHVSEGHTASAQERGEEETRTNDEEVSVDFGKLQIEEDPVVSKRPAAKRPAAKLPPTPLKKPSVVSGALMAKAEENAKKLASRPVSAKKGGQKEETLMKKPSGAVAEKGKSDKSEHVHPKLGKLFVTKASKQAYIQYNEGGSKKLLVAVSADAASKAGMDYKNVIDVVLEACVTHALDKPNAVGFRDPFLKDGEPPY